MNYFSLARRTVHATPRPASARRDFWRRAFVPAMLAATALLLAAWSPTSEAQRKPAARRTSQPKEAKPAQTQAGVKYSCPMHPEVVSHQPGKCPKCGMTLRAASHANETKAPAASSPSSSSSPREETGNLAKIKFPDVEVLNQNGERLHFYRDLVKGKTVAINFIFTTCTTICPPLDATFARMQKELGERAGRDVHLISISVDPLTDTPERLKAWGAKFRAGAGWTFVTGEKTQVDELLRAVSASSANPQDHTPTVIIGNDARGEWTRAYGLSKPSQLIAIIKQMLGEATPAAAAPAAPAQTSR